jgi:hypothetical protein
MEPFMKSFKNKLTICAFAVVSFVGVADAAQRVVFEVPVDESRQEISADFAVNRELGRAWVDVKMNSTNVGEEAQFPEVISKAVEGLYYDPYRKQVLYRTATESIVCAEDARFLWSTYLKATGRCLLTPVFEQRKVDDGFNIRKETLAKVVFEAQPSAVAAERAARSGSGGAEVPAEGAPDNTVLVEQLKGAEIPLEQGLASSTAEGEPISAKFELENGRLQLSVYIAKGKGFRELIVDHKTGRIAKSEAITSGDDLAAAVAQGDAMAKAKTSLQGALAKASSSNEAYRAVSVVPAMKDGRPIAYITLMKGEQSKTVSERLD